MTEGFAVAAIEQEKAYDETVRWERPKEVDGVAFTVATLTDRRTEERRRVYATEDGFTVSPMVGSFGSGVRWGVSCLGGSPAHSLMEARRRRIYAEVSQSMSFDIPGVKNLAGAADFIKRTREGRL